ncbi:MAG: DUF3990 domain-containing protein [Treponema sp.]|jgi:hypothetical protein|nr:DUF3990 domain-containing protein [Treponema sp.]
MIDLVNIMTLYHGSNQIIEIPELRPSIRTLDFGQGFYTTTNKEQAVNFAIKVYDRAIRTGDIPKGRFISTYEADYEVMQKELDILHFESVNEAWFDFVMANRRSFYMGKKYDVIHGPVANDTIYRTLIAFETGELSKIETIARLNVRQLFDQMTFASERSLSFLKFSSFTEVTNV